MAKEHEAGLLILKQHFGENFQTSEAVRSHHANSTTWIEAQTPDAVVFPQTTEEVSDILKICHTHDVPVIAFGAGSSLEGHVNAPEGGVSIDMSLMNAVTEVIPEDMIAVVQPGVTRERLNEELRATGLQFPIDPGADASIGGMVATRASGTNAVRYGTMAENILSLECVLADGQIVNTGTRAKKSSAGYDLTRLMVGSEGTLGIVTEVTLKLRGIPEHVVSGVTTFPSVKAACDAVIMSVQCGLDIGRLELLDSTQIKACNAYSKLELDEKPTLFFEFSGMEGAVEAELAMFRELIDDAGALHTDASSDETERRKLWRARHDAYWAAVAVCPGKVGIVTDACVPISQLADCITETQEGLETVGLFGTILGHVGDGNFHVILSVDPDDNQERDKAQSFIEGISMRAIAAGGTCTGEHGIGQGKREILKKQAGPSLNAMAAIKQALDPKGILNPGKLFAE